MSRGLWVVVATACTAACGNGATGSDGPGARGSAEVPTAPPNARGASAGAQLLLDAGAATPTQPEPERQEQEPGPKAPKAPADGGIAL